MSKSVIMMGELYGLRPGFKIQFSHDYLGDFQYLIKAKTESSLIIFLHEDKKLSFFYGLSLSDGCRLFKIVCEPNILAGLCLKHDTK